MDLNALKAEINPVDSAQTVTFNTASGTGFAHRDLQANLGKAEIENGESIISANFTFELKNQANVFTDVNPGTGVPGTVVPSVPGVTGAPGYLGGNPKTTVGEFTGAFLSPMLERASAVQSDSAIYVKLLDGFAHLQNYQPIERLATNGIGFSLDGVTIVLADKAEDGANGAIYKAKNYTELKDALTARLAELASGQGLPAGADAATYAKLATFTVELGSNFTKANQAGDQVTGTELVIKDAEGSTLVPQGFSTFGGIHPYPNLNPINELTNQAPATSTRLISTNIDAENVGYGSQGATLNIAGQSASKKGIEEFKVTATKDVWFTRLESRDTANNQHLQDVLLQTGSEGYFRVGTQDKGDSLVALVKEDFSNKGAGLVDVLKLDASAANSTAVNAFISDKVIARNYNLKDTDNNYKTDDVQVSYNLTGGNDVLQLAVASEVLAYADTQVSIVAGGGDDLVHLKVVANAPTIYGPYGQSWLANQQLNDNVKIDAASGNNTIWTEGSGNVRISTGGGNDTIYTDNSGRMTIANQSAKAKMAALGYGDKVNSLIVMNAQNNTLNDLLSNSTTPNAASNTGAAQQQKLFNATVQVKFEGFESKFIQVESTNYRTSTQQVNQAIKKAINEDPVLNKLLVAIEFPGNVLIVESLIDGVRTTTSLDVSIIAPVTYNGSETAPQKAARELKGAQMLGQNDALEATKVWSNPKATVADSGFGGTITASTTAMNNIYKTGMQNVREDAGTAAVVATPTQGATEVMEIQNFDLTGVSVANTQILTFTIDGSPVVYTNSTGGALTGAGLVSDIATVLTAGASINGSSYAFAAATTTTVLTITQSVVGKDIANITAVNQTAAGGTIGAPAAGSVNGVAPVNEVQTIDLSAVTVDGGQTLIFTPAVTGGLSAPITYTNGSLGDPALSGNALALAVATAITTDGNATVLPPTGNVVTVTYGGTAANKDVGEIVVTGTAAGIASQTLQGQVISTHSDNVINSGAGNDVVVLGTGTNSNDTLKFTGYDNGKNVIVNFSTGATSADRDFLDFREYLQAKDAAKGVLDAVTYNAGANLTAGNEIAVVNFTLSSDTAKQYVEDFEGLTAAKFLDAVNTQATGTQITYGGLDNSKLNAAALTAGAETSHYVALVHNQANVGEYKAFHLTATAGNTTNNFADAKLIGTYDFGASNNGATSELSGLALADFVAIA